MHLTGYMSGDNKEFAIRTGDTEPIQMVVTFDTAAANISLHVGQDGAVTFGTARDNTLRSVRLGRLVQLPGKPAKFILDLQRLEDTRVHRTEPDPDPSIPLLVVVPDPGQ